MKAHIYTVRYSGEDGVTRSMRATFQTRDKAWAERAARLQSELPGVLSAWVAAVEDGRR